jgi:hypothetical protein
VQFVFPLVDAHQCMIIGVTRRGADRFSLHASFDHRVSEGLQVARFLGELRDRVLSHFHAASPTAGVVIPRCSICDQSMQAEVDLGGRGLLRVALPDGSDGFLCRNCFRGW